jgi:exonuclease SbcD
VEWHQLTGVRPFVDRFVRLTSQEQVTETILSKLPSKKELEGAVLRLVLDYPRDWEKLIDEAALREYTAGTFELHLVKRPQVEARIRLPENRAVGSLSPIELLEVYWNGSHVPTEEQVELKKLVEEIIREE